MSETSDTIEMSRKGNQMTEYKVPVWIADTDNRKEPPVKLNFKDWKSAIAFVQRFNADEFNRPKVAYLEGE